MKEQVNVRVSKGTKQKLDELTQLYGTQTETVAIAVCVLYLFTYPISDDAAAHVIKDARDVAS